MPRNLEVRHNQSFSLYSVYLFNLHKYVIPNVIFFSLLIRTTKFVSLLFDVLLFNLLHSNKETYFYFPFLYIIY